MDTGPRKTVDEQTRFNLSLKIEHMHVVSGEAAMLKAGVPEELSSRINENLSHHGTIYVARAGNRPRYEFNISPKAGNNLSKSSTQYLMRGFLVENPNYGRIKDNGDVRGHHKKDIAGLILHDVYPDPNDIESIELTDAQQQALREKFSYSPYINEDTDIPNFLQSCFGLDITHLETDKQKAKVQEKRQSLTNVPVTLHQLLEGIKEGDVTNARLEGEKLVFEQSGLDCEFCIELDESWPEMEPNYAVEGLRPDDLPNIALPKNLEEFDQWIAQGKITKANICHDTVHNSEGWLEMTVEGSNRRIVMPIEELGEDVTFSTLSRRHQVDLKDPDTLAPSNRGSIQYDVYERIRIELERNGGDSTFRLQENGEVPTPVRCFSNDDGGLPVSGDIDGLLTGIPLSGEPSDHKIYNTFSPNPMEMVMLVKKSNDLLLRLQQQALDKKEAGHHLDVMDECLLELNIEEQGLREFVSETQLARAGCISPFQFVQMQLLNYAYRKEGTIDNLFQHGYDMHNPYGCNAEGAALMYVPGLGDKNPVYCETQNQLCSLLCTGDLLKDNHFDVNFGCDMSEGWADVVQKQMQLKKEDPSRPDIPYLTQTFYNMHLLEQTYDTQNLTAQFNQVMDFLDAMPEDKKAEFEEEIKDYLNDRHDPDKAFSYAKQTLLAPALTQMHQHLASQMPQVEKKLGQDNELYQKLCQRMDTMSENLGIKKPQVGRQRSNSVSETVRRMSTDYGQPRARSTSPVNPELEQLRQRGNVARRRQSFSGGERPPPITPQLETIREGEPSSSRRHSVDTGAPRGTMFGFERHRNESVGLRDAAKPVTGKPTNDEPTTQSRNRVRR